MKQFSIKELSASPSKVIGQAPCEIVKHGRVVAVIQKKPRKVKVPDYAALMKKVWGRTTGPVVDYGNVL